ncbi:MAG: DUF4149 domain-containing protein [Gammaproteobacteria bacterium]|nr:MAG: DUF4149 domain-containing protein [Gammaproteobacteria bacterium]
MIRGRALGVGEQLLQTLWVGCLWTVGYLVAPVLFAELDSNAQAGQVAGTLFTLVTWLSLVCGGLLLLTLNLNGADRLRGFVIVAMLVLVCANEWGIRPAMEAARLPDGTTGPRFGLLHGVSATMYLVTSLTGLFLVAADRWRISGSGE